MPVSLASCPRPKCRSPWQKDSRIKEIKLPGRAGPVVVGKNRLDIVRARKGSKDHRYILAVRKVAVLPAHIVSTYVDERTVMHPKGLINRVKTTALTTPPVTWSIGRGLHVETVVAIHFPATSSSWLVLSKSVGNVR
eukprot:5343788-Amphidinium_carterae.1